MINTRRNLPRKGIAHSGVLPGSLVTRILTEEPVNLALHELLSALLSPGIGTDRAHDHATRLLCGIPGSAELGPLRRLASATPREILTTGGLTRTATARIVAALELGRRLAGEKTARQGHIATSRELAERFTVRLRDVSIAEWWLLATSCSGRILAETRVAQGDPPHPRDVVGPALRVGASRIAIVHNDPFAHGKPKPSRAERELTVDIADAAAVMSVPLWEHVVIGKNRFFSYQDAGILTVRPRRPKGSHGRTPARLTAPRDVVDLVGKRLRALSETEWWMIGMNVAGEVLDQVPIFADGQTEPRAVLRAALTLGARRIALVRNDPAAPGKPPVSSSDHALATAVAEAASALGLSLWDHIVIGSKRYRSYRESGFLTKWH